jgi:hypothetical protein
MATFQQIIVNLIVGMFVFSVSVGLFGCAVRYEFNKHLAPRTWSRPRAVLKNVLKTTYFYRWYTWAFTLSYTDLLDGIPGTGTRKDGWAGPLLKSNLDGVIMLKFHTLLMKVSLLTSILCMFVIFPVNFTAYCDPDILGWGTCLTFTNFTNFEASTIAHLPPFDYSTVNETQEDIDGGTSTLSPEVPISFFVRVPGLGIRYFAVVAVALVIYLYTCGKCCLLPKKDCLIFLKIMCVVVLHILAVLLRREWIENVALRRVYYLEHDHYEERLEELEFIDDLEDPEDPFQKERPPWLPHPEIRETVPNVSLYSALYKLPTRFTTTGLPAGASDLERQLAATVEFFDECVPNQPGYSSSVVAVTILPEAKFVKLAWGKWYAAAKRLRKLRYIRSVLKAKLERDQAAEEVFVVETGEEGAPPGSTSLAANGDEEGPKTLRDVANLEQEEPIDPLLKSDAAENTHESEGDEPPTESSLLAPGTEASNEPCEENARDNSGESTNANEEADQFLEPSTVVSFGGTITADHEVDKQATPPVTSITGGNTGLMTNDNDNDNDEVRFKTYSDFDPTKYARRVGMLQDSELKLDEHFANLDIEQLSVYAREFSQK